MVEVSDNERGDTGDWMPRGDTGATAGEAAEAPSRTKMRARRIACKPTTTS